ncbi:YbjN domain-containing protein [Salipiger sp.]|uniref:YbjN domain-containing protein n=1 Tax=Salipiger sp. TaxID=2078585 RepID=UPI003A982C75
MMFLRPMTRWSIQTGAALAVVATCAFAAPSSAATLNASDPESIAERMRELGYRAELTTDSYGDPMIKSGAAGVSFSINFYGCRDNTNCQDLQFSAGFNTPEFVTPAEMNSWNHDRVIGKAHMDSEGDPFLEHPVLGVIDMGEPAFDRTVERWVSNLQDFLDYIDW